MKAVPKLEINDEDMKGVHSAFFDIINCFPKDCITKEIKKKLLDQLDSSAKHLAEQAFKIGLESSE